MDGLTVMIFATTLALVGATFLGTFVEMDDEIQNVCKKK